MKPPRTFVREEFIDDQTFNQYHEKLVQVTLEDLADNPTELTPYLYAHTVNEKKERHLTMMAIGFPLGDDRLVRLAVLGHEFATTAQGYLAAVYLVSEAWRVKSPDGRRPAVQPRDHPDREEIITIDGLTIDLRLNHATIEISRNEIGGMVAGSSHIIPFGGHPRFSQATPNKMLKAFVIGYLTGFIKGME